MMHPVPVNRRVREVVSGDPATHSRFRTFPNCISLTGLSSLVQLFLVYSSRERCTGRSYSWWIFSRWKIEMPVGTDEVSVPEGTARILSRIETFFPERLLT